MDHSGNGFVILQADAREVHCESRERLHTFQKGLSSQISGERSLITWIFGSWSMKRMKTEANLVNLRLRVQLRFFSLVESCCCKAPPSLPASLSP